MDRKKLSDEIAMGINRSIIGYVVRGLIIGFSIAFFIMLLLSLIGDYQTHQLEEKYCGGQPCPSSYEDNCQYENLYCKILVSCGSVNYQYNSFSACGYQEANAEFEILKPRIISNLKGKYQNNETWHNKNCKLVDYLEC